MDAAKEFFACLALRHTPGIGPKTWKAVLGHYDSAYEAVRSAADWPALKLARAHQAKACAAEGWRAAAEEEFHLARSRGMRVITWFDPLYPPLLKQIPDPPVLLYCEGDAALLVNPAVAVVGARKCTDAGLLAAARIATRLSRWGVTVVSGMAQGIDRQAHQGGLSAPGSSVAVLGTGLDQTYPAANRDLREALAATGCIVTEYGPGTKPEAKNFPWRNRIISGLSLGVLVAEAADKSGSLITARLAAEHGREVFALPGPVGQPTFTGCHRLIKQGAALVETAEDIVQALEYHLGMHLEDPGPHPDDPEDAGEGENGAEETPRPEPTPRKASGPDLDSLDLDDDQRAVLQALDRREKKHIDALCRELGWESARLSSALLMLEVASLVRQWPGMYYALV